VTIFQKVLYRLHRHPVRVVLNVEVSGLEQFRVVLEPGRNVRIMTTVTVGHKLALSVSYLDTNGNPMLTAPPVDSPPAWSNSNAAAETIVAAADGQSAVATTVAAGNDVISLSVVSGGKTFAATLAVEVDAAPQVLGSVAIVAAVQ
jgi:hypothetical protein